MNRELFAYLNSPVRIGIAFFLAAVVLSVAGILRNPDTPATIQTVFLPTLISGMTWGIISWAIATAVIEVEDENERRDGKSFE